MLLLLGEALRSCDVSAALASIGASSPFWTSVCTQQTHAEWTGMSLHDLIQPSFSFLVGLAVPLSMSSRLRKGDSRSDLMRHAFWRALIFVLLGIVLRQFHQRRLDVTFEDTLTQIGLGYPALFALAWTRPRTQLAAAAAILVGVWGAYVAFPVPGPGFDYSAVGVGPAFLAAHPLTGLAAHFQMNSNIGWAFDRVWLNLFPQTQIFQFNAGGYVTLNFVATLATMLLGLLACRTLTGDGPRLNRLAVLAGAGVACLAFGSVLDAAGLCPIVKRLWTPSFVLFSGGLCLLVLAACSLIADGAASDRWTLALRVVGTNSLLAYMLAELVSDPLGRRLSRLAGYAALPFTGSPYEPFLIGLAVILLEWSLLYVLFRRRVFLRV